MSSRHATFAIALGIAFASPLRAQQPVDRVRAALTAMGGEQAVRGVSTVAADYYLATFNLGQSEMPESPPRANIAYGRGYNDYRGTRRAFVAENRQVAGLPTRQRQVVTATIGLNEINGTQTALFAGAIATSLRVLRLQPEHLLITALDNAASLSALPSRTLRGQATDGIRLAGQDTVSIWFDRVTHLPLMIESLTDDPILGDRVTQTWFTRWQPAGAGVVLPRQIDNMWNGQLQQNVYYTSVTANAPLPDSVFAIADSIARRTPAPVVPLETSAAVTLNQLSPSVWRAEGFNYNTLIVEQPDQVVLVEAPFSTQRVRAVIDSVHARFPGKRIGAAVMTHYHWDHSSGIREIIAEGIPIFTMEQNAGFVRQVGAARRTQKPDLQAQRRRTPAIRTFTDSMVIGSGETAVVLYRMPSVHAEGLLAAWAPSARALFTSDVVNPGPQGQVPQPGSAELVALARARGLAPEKYAGGHGVIVNWSDIERASNP